jgi:hypothetical protein
MASAKIEHDLQSLRKLLHCIACYHYCGTVLKLMLGFIEPDRLCLRQSQSRSIAFNKYHDACCLQSGGCATSAEPGTDLPSKHW